jgi:hypothetical protein
MEEAHSSEMALGGVQLPSGEGGVFESRHRIIELHVIDAPGQLTDPWGGLDAEGAATSWRCSTRGG